MKTLKAEFDRLVHAHSGKPSGGHQVTITHDDTTLCIRTAEYDDKKAELVLPDVVKAISHHTDLVNKLEVALSLICTLSHTASTRDDESTEIATFVQMCRDTLEVVNEGHRPCPKHTAPVATPGRYWKPLGWGKQARPGQLQYFVDERKYTDQPVVVSQVHLRGGESVETIDKHRFYFTLTDSEPVPCSTQFWEDNKTETPTEEKTDVLRIYNDTRFLRPLTDTDTECFRHFTNGSIAIDNTVTQMKKLVAIAAVHNYRVEVVKK